MLKYERYDLYVNYSDSSYALLFDENRFVESICIYIFYVKYMDKNSSHDIHMNQML